MVTVTVRVKVGLAAFELSQSTTPSQQLQLLIKTSPQEHKHMTILHAFQISNMPILKTSHFGCLAVL